MLPAPEAYFSFSFTGIIWRILPNEQGSVWIIEIRDKASPAVVFAAIDISKGFLQWEDDTLAITSWTTAVALSGDVLLLQTYTQSTPPQVMALTAVSINPKRQVWERPKATFIQSGPEAVWVKETTFEKTVYLRLAIFTGAELEKTAQPLAVHSPAPTTGSIQYPVSYAEGSTYWNAVSGFLRSFLQVSPVNVVEYAETGHFIVISYYLYQDGQYNNWLAVFDQSGKLQWQEKIGSALPGTGNNTFLVTNNRLIFVKEKNQVVGYVL